MTPTPMKRQKSLDTYKQRTPKKSPHKIPQYNFFFFAKMLSVDQSFHLQNLQRPFMRCFTVIFRNSEIIVVIMKLFVGFVIKYFSPLEIGRGIKLINIQHVLHLS